MPINSVSDGIGIKNMLGPQDVFIKKATEQQKLMLEEYQDRTKISKNKLSSAVELQSTLNKIKLNTNNFIDSLQGARKLQVSNLYTNDKGTANHYLQKVSLGKEIPIGDTKIAVKQKIAFAQCDVGLTVDQGFDDNNPFNQDQTLTINYITHDGVNHSISVDVEADNTLQQVVDEINASIAAENLTLDMQATKVPNPNSDAESFIVISATKNKFARIEVNSDIEDTVHSNISAGKLAKVNINGVEHSSETNRFDVDSSSFEVTKVNQPWKYSTITIAEQDEQVANFKRIPGELGIWHKIKSFFNFNTKERAANTVTTYEAGKDTEIAVKQVSSNAETLIFHPDNLGRLQAFNKDHISRLLTITTQQKGEDAEEHELEIGPDDTVAQAIDRVNNHFAAEGKFRADIWTSPNNHHAIRIRAMEEGEGSSIACSLKTFNEEDEAYNVDDNDTYQVLDLAGKNSVVEVNGQEYTSNSRQFKVDGIGFELAGKSNSEWGSTRITVAPAKDASMAHETSKNKLQELTESLSELSYFINLHQQTAEFDDEGKLIKDEDSKSYLKNSPLIAEAANIWQRFTGSIFADEGEINSIRQLGLGLQEQTKNGVTYQSLYVREQNKFDHMFTDEKDFAKLQTFFVTDAKITPKTENISSLSYISNEFTKTITDYRVVGQELPLSIEVEDGEITVCRMIVDNNAIDAAIHRVEGETYLIAFPEDSPLKGMKFNIELEDNIVNAEEEYTIKYTNGMANLLKDDVVSMVGNDYKTGSISSEVKKMKEEMNKLRQESIKANKELKEFVAKLEEQYQRIMHMDMMAAIQMKMLESVTASFTAPAA
ncbi:MAG: hypothetical protein AB8B66_01955 [Rickettsiaceae bacterium]